LMFLLGLRKAAFAIPARILPQKARSEPRCGVPMKICGNLNMISIIMVGYDRAEFTHNSASKFRDRVIRRLVCGDTQSLPHVRDTQGEKRVNVIQVSPPLSNGISSGRRLKHTCLATIPPRLWHTNMIGRLDCYLSNKFQALQLLVSR